MWHLATMESLQSTLTQSNPEESLSPDAFSAPGECAPLCHLQVAVSDSEGSRLLCVRLLGSLILY